MAEDNKDITEIIAIISALRTKADKKLRDAIRKIIDLAYQYPFHNKQFTFDKDKTLSDNVNKILIELSDSIIFDIEDYSKKAEKIAENEEDHDTILAFIKRDISGEDLTQRIDKHMTRLRNALEGYIAVGFANFYSENDIYNAFIRNIRNPFGWKPMQDAYKDPMYEAEAIKQKGFVFGKHIDRNIEKAIALVISVALLGSFNYAKQLRYGREGAIGWTTIRGSTYDCPTCDSMVGIVHPMTEIFSLWHPNCLCILVPIYE